MSTATPDLDTLAARLDAAEDTLHRHAARLTATERALDECCERLDALEHGAAHEVDGSGR